MYNWKQDKLEAVLSEFGPLPEAGQEQLCRFLVPPSGRYQFGMRTTRRVTPSQQRDRLGQIENAANRLLQQLEDPFVKMWLSTANIQTAGRSERAVNAELWTPTIASLILSGH
jgi:hypothetical protein